MNKNVSADWKWMFSDKLHIVSFNLETLEVCLVAYSAAIVDHRIREIPC